MYLWIRVVCRGLKRADFLLTHPVSVGDHIVSRCVGCRQTLHQPQDLWGVSTWRTQSPQSLSHTQHMIKMKATAEGAMADSSRSTKHRQLPAQVSLKHRLDIWVNVRIILKKSRTSNSWNTREVSKWNNTGRSRPMCYVSYVNNRRYLIPQRQERWPNFSFPIDTSVHFWQLHTTGE